MLSTETKALGWLDKAVELVRPYIPENHEVDDLQWCEGGIQFCVFDCSTMESSEKPVDRFRFFTRSDESETENEIRFYEEIQRFIDSWN